MKKVVSTIGLMIGAFFLMLQLGLVSLSAKGKNPGKFIIVNQGRTQAELLEKVNAACNPSKNFTSYGNSFICISK